MFKRMPLATRVLLALNVALFVVSTYWPEFGLTYLLALYNVASDAFQPYQLVSHMFMHAGTFHLFFNMFALVSFGGQLEKLWGWRRFLIFYFVTGLGAAALHLSVGYVELQSHLSDLPVQERVELLERLNDEGAKVLRRGQNYVEAFDAKANFMLNIPTVGASGAIFGLLLGFAMLFPDAKLALIFFPVPVKAKYMMPFMMGLELYLGVKSFSWDNMAHFAHLGGALFGFLLIWLWLKPRMPAIVEEMVRREAAKQGVQLPPPRHNPYGGRPPLQQGPGQA